MKLPRFDAIPMEDGSVIDAEIATGNITRASGTDYKTSAVVAGGLAGPVPTGVAVGPDGSAYFSADRNNAVYRVRPRR